MTRIQSTYLKRYLFPWLDNPTLPLKVSRARYEDPMPLSWEVTARETPTCGVSIAEFTTWEEAQEWANGMSIWASQRGAEVRRYVYGYWPSGRWGGVGYFDIRGEYHELPDPESEERA